MEQRVQGNIDLHNRPTLHNADGSISTVRSMSIGTDDGEVLIPTVGPNGEDLNEDQAISLYERTRQHLGIFDTSGEATAYAEQLHRDQEREYVDPFAEQPVDPFAGPNQPGAETPNVNPDRVRRTAQLASLANLDPESSAGQIFQALDDKAAVYEEQISRYGEDVVRNEAAMRDQDNRLEGLGNLLQDELQGPEVREGAAAAYNYIAGQDATDARNYALERQAVENLQNLAASGDVTQARVIMQNVENGDALDVVRDYTAKQMILQNMLEQAQITAEDQPWFRDLADFALAAVPLNAASRTGNVDVDKSVTHWYDSFFSGQRFRRESEALWDMPIEEFSQFVSGDFIKNLRENSTLLGYTNNTEAMELIRGLVDTTPSATETNAWNLLDVASIPGVESVAKGVGKAAFSMSSSMIRNGARNELAQATAKNALDIITTGAERTMLSPEEVTGNLAVGAVNPNPNVGVGVATQAGEAMARGAALLQSRMEMVAQGRLTQAELEHARDVIVQRFERQYDREIKDVNIDDSNELTNGSRTYRIIFTMGKKSGGGFANETMAERYLNSVGMPGRAVQDESGAWFAQVVKDMSETGFYTELLNVQTPSPARFVLNARNVGDIDLQNAGQVAGNLRNRILGAIVEPYQKKFQTLSRNERDSLAQVIQAGETNAHWFTPDEFDTMYQRSYSRRPTGKEIEAYQAARDINDIEFALRNDDIYKQKVIKGFQTITFDTQGITVRGNAIVDRELKEIPKGRIYDITSDQHYAAGLRHEMTQKTWDRLRGQGYIVVTSEAPVRMADGTRIKTFLMKSKDAVVENLERQQVQYRPGGHRMYRGKYFVKQTVKGVQPDTMREFLDNPNTYIAAETRGEAKFWSDRMEAARQAYKNGDDLSVIDEILGGHAGLPDAKAFVKGMEDGTFGKDTKFDTYFDREMPDEYLSDGAQVEFLDEDDFGFNGFLRTNGRMYTGRKGEQLVDYAGEKAPLLDPYETINRSLQNIASLSSFGDYKIQSVERWMKTFGKLIDRRDMPEGMTDMRLFMEAPLTKGGNEARERLRSAALAQRQIIKRTLGWKTENDLRAEAYTRRLGDWVAGDRVDGLLPNARKALVSWTQDTNPISALRGFAFDLKLGMFNIGQLPLQLSTAVAATALSPKRGMQGWAMIAPMRFALGGRSLTKEALENRLDEMVSRGVHNIGGFKTGREFKDFAKSAINSGFFDLGGTHGLMDHYGPHAALDGFNSGVSKVREAGRFFFFEAERWNRIVSWRIAWDEALEGGAKVGSPEFNKLLAGRAEDYSFSMSRESQAWWQKGLLSIPTQFWAYNARMMEAMTVGNFTWAQKRRLMLSQTLLYGSAGLPITGAVSQLLKNGSGETPQLDAEDPFEKLLATADRGLIDQAVLSFTGADVSVGGRIGSGDWAVDTVRNIFGLSQYGEVSAADVLGGATFSIMGKVGTDILKPVVEYVTAESGDETNPMTRDSLLRLASNISTVGNITKALMVYNYGIYRTNTGTTSITDLPSQTAFAVALGIAPAEMEEITTMMSHFKDKSKQVDEAAKIINNYRTDLLNRPDQQATLQEDINAFVRLLPPDVRMRALQRASETVDPSLYASLTERLEREKAQEDGFAN